MDSPKPKFILCKICDNAKVDVFHEDVITADNQVFYLNNNLAITTSDTDTWDVSAIDASTLTPYFRDDYESINADNMFSPVARCPWSTEIWQFYWEWITKFCIT